jgi:hypothetical protein
MDNGSLFNGLEYRSWRNSVWVGMCHLFSLSNDKYIFGSWTSNCRTNSVEVQHFITSMRPLYHLIGSVVRKWNVEAIWCWPCRLLVTWRKVWSLLAACVCDSVSSPALYSRLVETVVGAVITAVEWSSDWESVCVCVWAGVGGILAGCDVVWGLWWNMERKPWFKIVATILWNYK